MMIISRHKKMHTQFYCYVFKVQKNVRFRRPVFKVQKMHSFITMHFRKNLIDSSLSLAIEEV